MGRWRRIAPTSIVTTGKYLIHRLLSLLPRSVHRCLVDSNERKQVATSCVLFVFSGRYQTWLGRKHIDNAIDRWVESKRISFDDASSLRGNRSGSEIRAYTRGFGIHVALKFLAPIVIPAKIGSVMAFIANGNAWFLVPLLATPILRMIVTMGNWFQTRRDHVRHREALAVSWLPFVGSIAFPLQMFATRPELATFLIRDAASRVGCKLPIYGGADSRTELACIRSADFIIEVLDVATSLTGASTETIKPRLFGGETEQEAKTRFGRWLDYQTDNRIESDEVESQPSRRIAA